MYKVLKSFLWEHFLMEVHIYSQTRVLKLSRNKKDTNDITAAPFSVSFSQLPAAKKKPPKTGQL